VSFDQTFFDLLTISLDEQRIIIRFLANRNCGANEIAAVLKENFGQDSSALRMVQGWLVELRRERKDLHGLHRSGSPSLDLLDAQILAALQKMPL
jgi:hypothetical protein